MSNINLNNYEAYLLDYVEQNLSPDLVAELMLFLEQNPEAKTELEAFENVFLNIDSHKFDQKENLRKIAIEDLMIAELEGLNSSQESKELFAAIDKNPAYSTLFTDYQKTILKPTPIIFADKTALKQKEIKVVPLYWWVSSAAAVLVMFLLLKNFNNDVVDKFSNTNENSNLIITNKEILPIVKEENVLESTPNLEVANNNVIPDTKKQLAVSKSQPQLKHKKTNSEQSIADNQTPATKHQQPVTKNMITIEPPKKEYIEIDAYVAEVNQPKQEEFLSVSELLKKEAQKRLLENEVKNNSTELVAANVVAKVLGKNAEVETAENENGDVKEYALNIGGFSISRKIRK